MIKNVRKVEIVPVIRRSQARDFKINLSLANHMEISVIGIFIDIYIV